MVKQVASSAEFQSEIQKPGLTVVDYFATWCGPCKQIAPFIDGLAGKYPNVNFIKVDVDQLQDVSQQMGIQAMPTFHFFVKGNKVDELRGANPQELESKVIRHKVDINPFGGSGFTLSSSVPGSEETPQSLREARLRAMGVSGNPSLALAPKHTTVPTAAASTSVPMDEDDEIALAIALSMEQAATNSSGGATPAPTPAPTPSPLAPTAMDVASSRPTEAAARKAGYDAATQDALDNAEAQAELAAEEQAWGDEFVPVPVNEEMLAQLVEMGISDTVGRKGLTNGGSLEGALGWIAEHQDDADIDQPYMVRKSDLPKPVLTEEERARKVEEMKEKIRKRKQDIARQEKEIEIKREKERRESGQKLGELQEERDRMARKRETERQKREKLDEKKEKERLLAEIARDKELRKRNKGVLPSVLGVEGYAPSAVQYDGTVEEVPGAGAGGGTGAAVVAPAPAPAAAPKALPKTAPKVSSVSVSVSVSVASPAERIDQSIQTLLKYRTAGAGGAALKLLLTFVKNVADSPSELKFRSINMESAAFKSKLSALIGPVNLLKALGFQKDEADAKLKLEGDIDHALFVSTVAKLTQAEATFRALESA